MLGDGKCVDLFKLYWVVKEKGGYESVTENGLWNMVAEKSGLDSDVGSAVKLIYVKYLNLLDGWLQRILKEKSVRGGLAELSSAEELEAEIKSLLYKVLDQKMDFDSMNGNVVESVKESSEKGCDGDCDEVLVLDPSDVNLDFFDSLKRKRESLLGMLDWVKKIAESPGDPDIENFVWENCSRKGNGVVQFWAQALVAREALLLNRHVHSSFNGSRLEKRQKMHPSMYEDYVGAGHLSTEKLRCNQRFLSLHRNYQSGSCSESYTLPDSDLDTCQSTQVVGLENHRCKRSLRTLGSLTTQTVVNLFCKDQLRKRVPVGPFFQAEVPDWTGVASKTSYIDSCNSDSKWLGTQLWPPQPKEHDSLVEIGPIGKGRPHSCGCKLPGSVECIRFHVADKRVGLKLELGSAFYSWRFNHMGEEVSLSWTEEEERTFTAIVDLNPPSLDGNFWDQVYKCFPYKSRQILVSYYFNVFLLRRRSYQNRATPSSIDSDDESEFWHCK